MAVSIDTRLLRNSERELVERLIEKKCLTTDELRIVIAEQKRLGHFLHTHIIRLGLMTSNALRDIRAALYKLPVADLSSLRSDSKIVQLLTGELAKTHRIIPIALSKVNKVILAVAEPSDLIGIDQVSAHLLAKGINHIELALASEIELHREIDRVFGNRISVEEILAANEKDPPIDKIVEAILQQAYDMEASDVHFEPEEYFLRIRMRIDGGLKQTHLLPALLWAGLAVRLKILSGMNIAENRQPQDGRFGLKLGISNIDFRAACLPTSYGENIVLRLLDKNKNIVPFERIDISPHARKIILKAVSKTEGIILITGPTGSGKTTTLYSVLSSVSSEETNVMTLEDPIEYPLPLIRQTQVTEKLNFADGVRALMRQDPDVILVGEIRDQETAEMAFRAAMTGHQVFATLHTNSALASIQRLRDIGVSPDILSGNMIAAIGQRLARKLCLECKKPDLPTLSERTLLGITAEQDSGKKIYRAIGCVNCGQSGYKGRFVLMEILLFDEKIDELISNNAGPAELAQHARKNGYVTLTDDAIRRVLVGDTTIEAVSRSVSLSHR
jgi:type II secretory ATPase GspE/PulE/Tfp pilus assembly ATPase PilB-like protein